MALHDQLQESDPKAASYLADLASRLGQLSPRGYNQKAAY